MMHQSIAVATIVAGLTVISNAQGLSPSVNSQTHHGEITLDTTQGGLSLPKGDLITDYPLLLRFTGDQFPWDEASADGSDIKIENNAHVVLPMSIEEWNPKAKRAAIWVRLPLLRGDDRQSLDVSWGKSRQTSKFSARVFDASNGFTSVLHFMDGLDDTLGNLSLQNDGSIPAQGVVGSSIHLRRGAGVSATTKAFPTGSQASTTSAWVRIQKPNGTILGWGNEARQGKVVMQHRSPSHINMDCYFSDANVRSLAKVPFGQWIHVAHVYQKGTTSLYVDGKLEGTNKGQGAPLAIAEGARMWLGGWYGNYDFEGDIDEVRISHVARSEAWVKLDADTQGPDSKLTGRLVRSNQLPTVDTKPITVDEGSTVKITADFGNAEKAAWELVAGTHKQSLGTNISSLTFGAPRVGATSNMMIRLRTTRSGQEKIQTIPLIVREAIADPEVSIVAPATWDGRSPAYVRADVADTKRCRFRWHVDGPAVAFQSSGNVLRLDRGFKAGVINIKVDVDNGGEVVTKNVSVVVSPPKVEPWTDSDAVAISDLKTGMFISRGQGSTGRIAIKGSERAGATVVLRAIATDGWIQVSKTKADAKGTFTVQMDLPARLTQYSLQLISEANGKPFVLASVADVQCGDAFIIMGQSNAVATDFGPSTPSFTSPWIQTFTDSFVPARYRNTDGQTGEIGYWGMELARKLVSHQKVPVCFVNGAVGGTRIDQHQRNNDFPVDPSTLYGNLLKRVTNAGLRFGIRAIFWHQGENDQGADGPSGGFGHETYRDLFVQLSNSWANDYPNSRMTYMFQIWPKSCAMGIDGSDNVLRDVQRQLPDAMDRVAIMSTLGIDPPGGCHYPADGYAAMANLIYPLVRQHTYGVSSKGPIGPPRLLAVTRDKPTSNKITLMFDQPVVWSDSLRTEFLVDGKRGIVARGKAAGSKLHLTLASPAKQSLTYLDSATWSQQRLLRGKNGIAALTFANVPIR